MVAPPPAAPSGSKAGLVVSVLIGVLILGAGGYLAYKRFLAKPSQETATTQGGSQPAGNGQKQIASTSKPGGPAPTASTQVPAGAIPGAPERTTRQSAGSKSAPKSGPPPTTSQSGSSGSPFFAEPVGSIQPPRSTTPAAPTPAPPVSVPEVAAPPQQERPIYATPVGAIPPPRSETPAAPSAPATASKPTTPGYRGPTSGLLIWSGSLRRDGLIVIEGDRASEGTLQGALPGVPVMVETEFKDVGLAEMPSPSNGWKRLSFRGRRNQNVVVTLRWRVLQ